VLGEWKILLGAPRIHLLSMLQGAHDYYGTNREVGVDGDTSRPWPFEGRPNGLEMSRPASQG
jgi:hypothetical protein